MLTELSITDLAIIDNLVIRFDAGLTVLTGETGAGKSIIIDALQLALGARASPDAVRGGAKFAFLEAIFDVSDMLDGTDLRELLEAQGMEWQDTLICRREVSANGRSAARVNGMAVPLSVLSGIGRAVVDVHGQSDHLAILNARRQLEVLDRFGGLLDARRRGGRENQRVATAPR